MITLRNLVVLVVFAGGFSGCASTRSAEKDSDSVSTIPWNRPATWEGRGPLGGMMMMNGN